jgi:hypothetical protein
MDETFDPFDIFIAAPVFAFRIDCSKKSAPSEKGHF